MIVIAWLNCSSGYENLDGTQSSSPGNYACQETYQESSISRAILQLANDPSFIASAKEILSGTTLELGILIVKNFLFETIHKFQLEGFEL